MLKKSVLLSLAAIAAAGAAHAHAQVQTVQTAPGPEVGRVLSSTPVIQQVAVPRQVCNTNTVAVEQPTTGAGGVLGAIAGGAVGSQIGGGSGRGAATVLGVIGGALLGNNIEGGNRTSYQNVQQCSTQTFYENRTAGYNVVYEYAGRQYQVNMPHDPGPTVQLQVTPVNTAPPAYAPPAPQTYAPPVYEQQPAPVTTYPVAPPVVVAPPTVIVPSTVVYPTYYARPHYYRPPVSLSIGYISGPHHRRHWR